MRTYGQLCPVARTLDVVGDRWNLLIVRELLLRGPSRYTDLRRGLPGIATNLLTTRLREMEEAGIVVRRAPVPPQATDLFELTDSGRELGPVLEALATWGVRHLDSALGTGKGVFRSHWLAFPVSRSWQAPADGSCGPGWTIEIRVGDDPVTVEVAHGQVRTVAGSAENPTLVIEGPPGPVVSYIAGAVDTDQAKSAGVAVSGDEAILERLRR